MFHGSADYFPEFGLLRLIWYAVVGGQNMPNELQLSSMSIGEKLQLLEQVWNDLCQHPSEIRSPEWHAAIVKERQRQIENGTMTVSPWSEAKERLQKLGQ